MRPNLAEKGQRRVQSAIMADSLTTAKAVDAGAHEDEAKWKKETILKCRVSDFVAKVHLSFGAYALDLNTRILLR